MLRSKFGRKEAALRFNAFQYQPQKEMGGEEERRGKEQQVARKNDVFRPMTTFHNKDITTRNRDAESPTYILLNICCERCSSSTIKINF